MPNVVAHVIPNEVDYTFGKEDQRKLNAIKFENLEIILVSEYSLKIQTDERKSGAIIEG